MITDALTRYTVNILITQYSVEIIAFTSYIEEVLNVCTYDFFLIIDTFFSDLFDSIQNSLPKSLRRLFPQEDLEQRVPVREDKDYIRPMIVPFIDSEKSLPGQVSQEDKDKVTNVIAPTLNRGRSIKVHSTIDKDREVVKKDFAPVIGTEQSVIQKVINQTRETENQIVHNMNNIIDGFREQIKPIYPGKTNFIT